MNPERKCHCTKAEKRPLHPRPAPKCPTAFPDNFWQIVTTIQVEKAFCKASWKGESPYRSQGPSAQGKSMSLLQDTSVSEADAVEQEEAHILYTRLLGCLLAQSVPTAANKAMEAS